MGWGDTARVVRRSQAQPLPTIYISWQGRYTDNLLRDDERRMRNFGEHGHGSPEIVIHAMAQISTTSNAGSRLALSAL